MGEKTKIIDLRSDTVTKPDRAMLKAMMNAEVGDDVWGDDPTVNELQAFSAKMFGFEASLFCPSGTMTNQIAIKVHTQPGDELICSDTSHIYNYESGGIAFNSSVQTKLLPGVGGKITQAQVAAAFNADDIHFPPSRLVCLENTTNKGGGSFYTLEEMKSISDLCRSRGVAIHLDGARVLNAAVAAPFAPAALGAVFDSVSVCLSKSLGCPVGSLLLGSEAFIRRSKRIRKVLGGGMRQAGFLAAAGLYALKNNVERLKDDHQRAQRLGQVLGSCSLVEQLLPVDTNIVLARLRVPAETVAKALAARGVLASSMGAQYIRFVTHLQISDEDVVKASAAIRECMEAIAQESEVKDHSPSH